MLITVLLVNKNPRLKQRIISLIEKQKTEDLEIVILDVYSGRQACMTFESQQNSIDIVFVERDIPWFNDVSYAKIVRGSVEFLTHIRRPINNCLDSLRSRRIHFVATENDKGFLENFSELGCSEKIRESEITGFILNFVPESKSLA